MGQDVGVVESGHGQLGEDHLGESREGTINQRLPLVVLWTYLKTPNRSALKAPKPAAAEKFPRSMIPLETNTLLVSISANEKRKYELWVGLVDDG